MKKSLFLIPVLIVLLCLSGSVVLAGKKGETADHINWYYKEWCNYCKEMDQTSFRNPSVIKLLNKDFVAIRVNTNKETKVAGQYNIRPVPDNWFLSADGKKLRNFLGYYEADQFVTVIRYVNEKL